MRERQSQLLWMKDLIEHMARCHEQLQWTDEGPSAAFLADALHVDLRQCLRLCDELRGNQRSGQITAMASA